MSKPATAKTRSLPHRSVVLLNQRSQEIVRSRIHAAQLVDRLQKFALHQKHGSKYVDMSDAQVRAAFGLLAKIVPDLQRVELTGGEDIGANAATVAATQRATEVLFGLQNVVDASMEYQRLMFESSTKEDRLKLPAIEGEGSVIQQ